VFAAPFAKRGQTRLETKACMQRQGGLVAKRDPAERTVDVLPSEGFEQRHVEERADAAPGCVGVQ
jgi:hypothetical protein